MTLREAHGNKTAFFNLMATAGHRTHPNVHISELTGAQAYAHKHGNQPMFIILKGAGYDYWSEASDLKAFEEAVRTGKAHKQEYKEGTLCGVPPAARTGTNISARIRASRCVTWRSSREASTKKDPNN